MERGADGEDELLALFAEDAVYVEPFSGGPAVHEGREAIRRHLDGSLPQAPPGLRITVDAIHVDGDVVRAEWTCESVAWSRPARGHDRFVVRDGRIARLETTLDEPPQAG